MFISLLLGTFILAAIVSFIIAKVFDPSIEKILARIIKDEISVAWKKYLKFAIIVVGISGGVRIWTLEQYLNKEFNKELTGERIVLEIYTTIISTMQSLAWLLLVFFLFALIAYVIVRGQEVKALRYKEEK
ncbi:MAG TPA: hypothetical protein VFF33_13130 [Ignavibacteriaceae bacterium]|nr:hypothetical protein [Ignavibacteriaceae bacterium]